MACTEANLPVAWMERSGIRDLLLNYSGTSFPGFRCAPSRLRQRDFYPCLPKDGGFTLLEVLVALSIFALVGLGAYRLLDVAVSHQGRLQHKQEGFHSLRITMDRMANDFLQVAPRSVRDEQGTREPAFRGEPDKLLFTRSGWSNPRLSTRGNLQRVQYQLVLDKEAETPGEFKLVRQFWTVLDRAPDTRPVQQELISGVSAMTLTYLDHQDNLHYQWPPLNSSEQEKTLLPLAVNVELLTTEGEFHRRFLVSEREAVEGSR